MQGNRIVRLGSSLLPQSNPVIERMEFVWDCLILSVWVSKKKHQWNKSHQAIALGDRAVVIADGFDAIAVQSCLIFIQKIEEIGSRGPISGCPVRMFPWCILTCLPSTGWGRCRDWAFETEFLNSVPTASELYRIDLLFPFQPISTNAIALVLSFFSNFLLFLWVSSVDAP